MPPFVGRKPLSSKADLRGHSQFEFIVGNFKERKEFPYENADILLVDEGI